MTGSTLNLILISVVVTTVLAVAIVLVFYADAHPAGRREAPARPAPEQTQAPPSAARDTDVPAERAAPGPPRARRAPRDPRRVIRGHRNRAPHAWRGLGGPTAHGDFHPVSIAAALEVHPLRRP
jgi:hypothetical protein